ncbi:MAG: cysteine desulfurase [Cytophagales bacterium]|nr:MAG: cysteine desulfurase [Cytophagales bacterium]
MIYLDNNATTKIDESVLAAAMPFLTENFANASSTHKFGISANEAVKKARVQVANLLGCQANEIIFTSGATEAINLIIKGLNPFGKDGKEKKHIVTAQTEHTAVLDTCAYMETIGYEVTYLPVQKDGLLDLTLVKESIREDTLLVCIMLANNEIGTIQPIQEIADLAHQKGACFFTDATQAVGKIPIDTNEIDIDFLAFSGHKIHAPKGIGALFVRSQLRTLITPLQHGGGHEKGLRSGTLNVFGIVGLGQACEIAQKSIEKNATQIAEMRDFLESELLKIEHTFVNGNTENRLPNTTNICFEGADSEATILGLEDIAVSNGSACTSMKIEPSHVLKALNLTDGQAFQSIRFSLSKYSTMEEMKIAAAKITKLVKELREML